MMSRPPLRDGPPARFAPLWPREPGWGLFSALAASACLPLAIAAVTVLARPAPAPAPAPAPVKGDRQAVRTVIWYPPQRQPSVPVEVPAAATEAPPPLPHPKPLKPAAKPFKSFKPFKTTNTLCARYGMRQVWYGAYWRCRK